ncbi:sialidase family protein [Paenibacillus algorifonticola]|uniref:sialidase family protein n=1 Tax=Paenibacillus algorifonticola TaxID=684063 RepID=UPI003D2E0676
MDHTQIVNLKKQLGEGQCYLHHESDMIEAMLPTDQPSNHAPALIELANGDLLCIWFGGSDEGAGDIKVFLSRLNAKESKWSVPLRLSEDFNKSDQNPSLFQAPNGGLWAIHTSMDTRGCALEEWQAKLRSGEVTGPFAMQHTSTVQRRISFDNGYTWGEGAPLFERPGTFSRHPVTVLASGRWLYPVWYSSLDETRQFGYDYSSVHVSDDQGESWREVEIPGSKGRVHPSIVELDEGRLVVFFRSRNADYIYMSRSEDSGESWSVPERTILPNNNASIRAIRLQSGGIAIIFNHCRANEDPDVVVWPYERVPVTIAISEDEGVTWPYMRHIETGDHYCGELNTQYNRRYEYPSLIQSKDGMIHACFAYGNRTHIKYVSFSEDWVRGAHKNKWPWDNFPME